MKDFKTAEIKIIGAFLLVTGLFGLYTFLLLLFPLDNLLSFINLVPTGLFALTLYAGYLLLIKENVKGLEIARAVIALQIINFHIAGIGYMFITGIFVFIGFTNFNFAVNFGIDNNFIINLTDETSDVLFKVNVLALGIFLYLTRIMDKIYDKQDLEEWEIEKGDVLDSNIK